MSSFEESTLKRSLPTPKTMIRQKPPPKPPRMKPSMLDQSLSPTSPSPPSRETSPGIISLKSSIVDATRTLDAPVLFGGYTIQRTTSRLSPAKNSHREYRHNILQQIKPFIILQVDVERLLYYVCNAQAVKVDIGEKVKDEQAAWGRLVTVVLSREDEGYRALCDGLKSNTSHRYLADLLEALNQLLEIGIASESIKVPDNPLCCVCKYNRDNAHQEEGGASEVSKFDVEIICLDSETGQVKSMKEVALTKKPARQLFSSAQDKMLIKDDVNRYRAAISISIFNQCLCSDGVTKLAKLLQQYSCIRELYIVKNRLDLESIEQLFQGLQRNWNLHRLDLRLNMLDDACASKLFSCLSGNAALRVVNVASTELTSHGLSNLLSAFSSSKVLTELDIGFNNIQNAGAKMIAQCLANNCPLRKLRMRSNYVTADGAKAIFQALKKNSRLHVLDISVNQFKDEACTYVSQALLCNHTLKELNLEDCGICKSGCEMLARALKTNTNLKSLDLSRNLLGDEGVEALSEGVKYNQVLDVLSLNMCEIANCGFSMLMDALQYNTTMTTLKLCYNLIGYPVNQSAALDPDVPSVQDIYERVCQILQTNKDLKVLLWGNRLDYDAEEDYGMENCVAVNNMLHEPMAEPRVRVTEAFNGLKLEKQNGGPTDNNNTYPQNFGTPLAKRAFSEANVSTGLSVKEKQNWLYQM